MAEVWELLNENWDKPEVPGSDPGGLADVGELEELVKYLKMRVVLPMTAKGSLSGLASIVIQPVRGVILHGPPGTGKTLMAKSLAAELSKNGPKFSFLMTTGSEVHSMYVDGTENRLQELFARAERQRPTVLFLDEIDRLCPSRKENNHQVCASIVASLLGLMDAVIPGHVLVIGATNRVDAVDPAFLRPGRFDKHFLLTPPNEAGRLSILNLKLEAWGPEKPSPKVLQDLAQQTAGFTGADLVQLIQGAVDAGVRRQFPTWPLSPSEVNAFQVLEADWQEALTSMGRSNSHAFGNALYVGEMPDKALLPLFQGIIDEIGQKVRTFFPQKSNGYGLRGSELKSLLVWQDDEPALEVLDSLILPAVLGSLDPKKMPAFCLTLAALDLDRMNGIIEQALTSAREKSTILLVPRMDRLLDLDPIFPKFQQCRGKNLLILASGIGDLYDLNGSAQRVFSGLNRSYRMREPNPEERRAYFSSILSHKAEYQEAAHDFEPLLKLALEDTRRFGIQSIMTLHGELGAACTKYIEKEIPTYDALMKMLWAILTSLYENEKLRSSFMI